MRALAIPLLFLLLSGCGSVFFQPDTRIITTPDKVGLKYEGVRIQAVDGTQLAAWFLPSDGSAQGTILYLHGIAENISTHFHDVAWLPIAGFNVLALDYRGYGASDGIPTLRGVQLDIDAATDWLLRRSDVDPNRVIIFGRSLGASLAVYYAAHSRYRNSLRGLILDSPFSDYRLIARENMPAFFFAPLDWVANWEIPERYSPERSIGAVSPIPVLLIHGDEDSTVPVHHSLRLFERAKQPKRLWVVAGAGHLEAVRDSRTRERLTRFLHACLSGESIARAH